MKIPRVVFPVFFAFFLAASCSKDEVPRNAAAEGGEIPGREQPAAGPAWPVLALLETGKNPLWFEFGPEGPAHIASPSAASLAPYVPWPHARFAAGAEAWGDSLVFAINRGGFLIVAPGGEPGGALLYWAADPERWEPYTVASLFFCDNKPAVLLYRDDFFSPAEAPVPEHQVLVLREDSPRAGGLRLPALEVLPKEEGWEVNSLRRGPGGNWYYRFVQTGYPRPGAAHYRANALDREGELIGVEEYRNSSRPENASAGPAVVRRLLAAVKEYLPGLEGVPVLRALSPEPSAGAADGISPGGISGSGFFSANPDAAEEFTPLYGYYRSLPPGALPEAFALAPDGRGAAVKNGVFSGFSLPPLPEGFVYTAAGLAGKILVAAWEEQDGSLVGSAGLMVLDAETPELFGN